MMSGQIPESQKGMSSWGTISPHTPVTEKTSHITKAMSKTSLYSNGLQEMITTLSELTFPIKLNTFLSDFSHKQILDEKVWGLCNSSSPKAYKADVFRSAEVEPLKFRLQDRVKVVQSSQWECKCLQRSSSLFPQPEQTHYWAICKW